MKPRYWARYWRKAIETWLVISRSLGWQRSFQESRPVDGAGNPIPWYTYPAIEFIRSMALGNCRVFEYGCGNSSFFWARRTNEVFAVENDPSWAKVVRESKEMHLTVIEAAERSDYVAMPKTVGGKFDIVIVDGRFRRSCAEVACEVVSDTGMIIFDNADWYPDACADLRAKGWFEIDFSGLGPINPYAWTTAVFLRTTTQFPRQNDFLPTGGNPGGRHE